LRLQRVSTQLGRQTFGVYWAEKALLESSFSAVLEIIASVHKHKHFDGEHAKTEVDL